MKVGGRLTRTIALAEDGWAVEVIDQRLLPHRFAMCRLETAIEVATAIQNMTVRGAPLIGAAAAYGLCLAARQDPGEAGLRAAYDGLLATRPTAINLRWALDEIWTAMIQVSASQRFAVAQRRAAQICDDDVAQCQAIGEHGAALVAAAWTGKRPVQILTHCNAGWLATVDWGTALAPLYLCHQRGIPLHVWVDETRPRNQGAALTAWELGQAGIPHTLVVDNAGGHLMQRGLVDLVIVGSDRTTASGDVCNKIGTYLKALAARAHDIPFYVALSSTSIDWSLTDGVQGIPIEERDPREVTEMSGERVGGTGELATIRLTAPGTAAANFAFDVTPATLVTALITERGVCPATAVGLRSLFPEAP